MRLRFFPTATRSSVAARPTLFRTVGPATGRATVTVGTVVATVILSVFGPNDASAQSDTIPALPAAATTVPGVTDAAPPATTRPAATAPVAVIVKGRGFGHGRGLGQWGAYGYAVERGWNYRQILDHFYGGTVAGAVSPLSAIGVRLTALDNTALIVYQPKGRVFTAVDGQVGFTLPPGFEGAQSALVTGDPLNSGIQGAPVPVAAGTATVVAPSTIAPNGVRSDAPLLNGDPAAVKVEITKAGIVVSFGTTCSGPWTARPPVVTRSLTVSPGPPDPAADPNDPNEMLHACEGRNRRVYRGDFLVTNGNPGQRAVNLVGLDAYLRGVVPREIPPSWGDRGMAALRAQAVAARSYAAAEKRNGFSNTCDTISCQVYRGRGMYTGTSFQSLEDPRTDLAIAETANEIRVVPETGKPVRTEFSASTGGYTAGGEFPAVPDDGDAIAANPNHSWTVRFPVARFFNSKLGAFRDVSVLQRDGFGPDGGRVVKLKFSYEKGSTTMTGNEVMSKYGLRSSWFNLTTDLSGQVNPGVVDAPIEGVGDALTGDAGGPVAVASLVREVGVDTTVTTMTGTTTKATKTKATNTKSPNTKSPNTTATQTMATVQPKRINRATTTMVIAVAVGADPVRVVAGSETPAGSPTTKAVTKTSGKTASRKKK